MAKTNFLYGLNTAANLSPYHAEIAASLRATGKLPEELADLFTARLVDPAEGNPDGSPRYIIEDL